jgi:hypothetical protein
VNFCVSTKVSWVIEKWNSLDSNLLIAIMFRNLGFDCFENKDNICSVNDSLESLRNL